MKAAASRRSVRLCWWGGLSSTGRRVRNTSSALSLARRKVLQYSVIPTCPCQCPDQPLEDNLGLGEDSRLIRFSHKRGASSIVWSQYGFTATSCGAVSADAQVISRALLDSIGAVNVNLSQTFLLPFPIPGPHKSATRYLFC